jgi:hypothetical protein
MRAYSATRYKFDFRRGVRFLLVVAFLAGAILLPLRPVASQGILQTIGDFLSLGANTVRELQEAIQLAGGEIRLTLEQLNQDLNALIKTLSDTYQDNLNITLNSLDNVTRNKIQEMAGLIDQVNEKLQEDIRLVSQEAQNVIKQVSLQLKQDIAFLQESLKDVIVVGGETAAFVIDRTFYNAVIVISLIALAIGLLIFIRQLFTGKLPEPGLSRTLILIFMAAYFVIFTSLALVPSVRAFAMTNLSLGLKQKLDKSTNQPRLVAVVPESITIGQAQELEIWGTVLLPGGKQPTGATVGGQTVPIKATSNDAIVLDVRSLNPSVGTGSVNVILTYEGGVELRGNVRLIVPTPTPTPADLVISASDYTLNPSSPLEDSSVTAIITVRNTGGAAGRFLVIWRPNAAAAAATEQRREVPGLAAGESTTFPLTFSYPNPGTFDSVVIVDVNNQVAERNEANNTITRAVTVRAIPTATPLPPSTRFQVTITTGDRSFAGTDANVFITLTGDRGTSQEFKLDTANHDDFEQGNTDAFTVVSNRAVGNITSIRLRHDNSGLFSGWFCQRIVIRNLDTGQQRTINVNRWFATDEDDGSIDRILRP